LEALKARIFRVLKQHAFKPEPQVLRLQSFASVRKVKEDFFGEREEFTIKITKDGIGFFQISIRIYYSLNDVSKQQKPSASTVSIDRDRVPIEYIHQAACQMLYTYINH
jgi:hypothetical protein